NAPDAGALSPGRRGRWGRTGKVLAGLLASMALAGAVYGARVVRAWWLDKGKVVARVNGEPIYEDDVRVLAPVGTFLSTLENGREGKTNRLIEQVEVRQFLGAHQVAVPQKEVDTAV